MAVDAVVAVRNSTNITGIPDSNTGRAQLLRGGAIVEVMNAEQAKIAEKAGACAVTVLEYSEGGVKRMADPYLIKEIKKSVKIPVIAKCRVGHIAEAQILESIGVDYIDESEVLTIADDENYINKNKFRKPFMCGCRGLGEALRRVREGAVLIRTQGDLNGNGDIVDTVRNVRSVMGDIRVLNNMDGDEVSTFSMNISAPHDLVAKIKQMGRLPVAHFAAGGIATPADAALMMQLGCDGVILGCELFLNHPDPYSHVRWTVQAVRDYTDPDLLADAVMRFNDPHVSAEPSSELIASMAALNINEDSSELS